VQPDRGRAARWAVYAAALTLAVLHQDFWLWSDRHLVFGFMPIGLAYHALFSLAAATMWALAVKFAWPTELEAWADAADDVPRQSPVEP